jgi:glycerophosphoryl diester phosphodiesterase
MVKKLMCIGHRGAAGHAPENTISSFKKALELGADMIELDVHVCKTGEVMVIHDEKVNRTTNGKGFVAKKTLGELKELRIKKTEKIPTLVEVLDLIDGKCQVNIELKGKGTAKPTNRIIKKYVAKKNWSYQDFLISSFDYSRLIKIKELDPKLRISVLIKKSRKRIIELAERLNAYSINLSVKSLKKSLIEEAHKKRFKIFAYTVNKPKDIMKMKELGIDGIISDFPDRL